uniref:Serine protease n=1 Tax=Arenicola cristata TaxID=273048 RepID=A0A0A7CA12_ARECR|nr:serine protease [Arenicola cristata]
MLFAVVIISALLVESQAQFQLGRHRIIGGEDVDPPGKYPWQVSLTLLGQHNCGGSLITPQHVLTAAHCVEGFGALTRIRVGQHDRSGNMGDPRIHDPDSWVIHEEWGGINSGADGYPNDIAIIKLSEPVDMTNEYVDIIPLAEGAEEDYEGRTCVITGWGLTEDLVIPDILQEAPVQVHTQEFCREWWEGDAGGTVLDSHVCVSEPGERGACSGDSGGPLMCETENGWELLGITSWGHSLCNTNYPSVYGRVPYFRQWVEDNLN